MYNVMIEDVMVLDHDLIKILEYAEVGIRVQKALSPTISEAESEQLGALADKSRNAVESLKVKFGITN